MTDEQVVCTSEWSVDTFPIVGGIPLLINEERSLFSVSDFLVRTTTTVQSRSTLWRIGAGLTPRISSNIPAQENYRQLFRHLHASPNKPTVLSIGGSIAGTSMDQLLADQSIEFVDPDATFGPRTSIVCGAHDIPFTDGSFDLVIAQAVLEHVVDPHRWVEKIHRVLKDDGLVDAQTPYMATGSLRQV